MTGPLIEIRPAKDEDRAQWHALAEQSDDAWLGHSWAWNSLIEEGVWGCKSRSLVFVNGGRIVGIFPLHLRTRRRGPFIRRILYSNYWSAGGPALANDVAQEERRLLARAAIQAVHEQARRDRADKVFVTVPTLARRNLQLGKDADNPIAAHEMIDHTKKTRVIRFSSSSADDVWAGMEGRSRTAIRKAEREGVTIGEITGPSEVDRYYDLHLATYRRTGLAPYPRRFYEVLLAQPWSRFLVASHQGQPVAALGVLVHAGRALYAHSASLPEGQRLGANNLLQWHALKWMAASGFQAYEVGLVLPEGDGPLRKDVAIGRYKRSLGGLDEPSYRGEYAYATPSEAIFAVAQRGLALTRAVRPRLSGLVPGRGWNRLHR